ncbi:MAG: glucose 1-dehydrogenase [Dehalococcoidales bacterium]|nr:glucose 1-dehydrogenase [Dehalococcoidales bacterium]
MDLNLEGKVALVTGGGSQKGFGKGICLALAKNGCDVVVADVDQTGAEKTAAEIAALGRKSLAIKVDVTNVPEVKAMVEEVLRKLGQIDILVNNAGRTTAPLPFVETPEENWEIVFNLNVFGVFNCSKAVLLHMLQRKYGKIINIASGAGFSGSPRFIHYGASKAAVMAFTRGLAKETVASGINVNAVAPGLGDTNFLSTGGFPDTEFGKAITTVPTGKSTTPEEVGNLVSYLASDMARNVVGQTYLIDGGHYMH